MDAFSGAPLLELQQQAASKRRPRWTPFRKGVRLGGLLFGEPLLELTASENGVLGGRLFNWGQRKSLFPLHLGIKCCALEMAAAGASRFDAERFGVFFRSSPRQCDVLLVNGPAK